MYTFLGNVVYLILFLQALWGAYCTFIVWARVKQKKFESEETQSVFLESLEEPLSQGNYDLASKICADDRRAMCQLAQLAIDNRKLGYAKVKQLLSDRFQRDVIADLENNLSWIYCMIKSAPMMGLLGTIMGMMAAFKKLAVPGQAPDPAQLAQDIQFALITTADGLAIAIPLVVCTTFINLRIEKLKDLVSYGLNQFLEMYREALIRYPK